MPRLVIKTKKKRPPTGDLSRLKEQLRRLTEQLTSRDRELAEAAATGTNLQSVMDAIAQNAAELRDAVEHRGVAGRRQGKHVVVDFGSIRCGKFKRRTMKSIAPSPWPRRDRPRSGGRSPKVSAGRSM